MAKIYIGNLSYSTTENTLHSLFSAYGAVKSANVIKDKVTGNSKGFAFVEFEDEKAVQKAIAAQNGRELDGRKIRVSLAKERTREA